MSTYLYAVSFDGQDPTYVTADHIRQVLRAVTTEDDYMEVSIRRVGDAPITSEAFRAANNERVTPP